MTRRIVVEIAADGSISATSTGEVGPACLDDIALIEELCQGSIIVDSRLTPEYGGTETIALPSRETERRQVWDGQ